MAALDLVYPACCPVCGERLGPGRRDPLCAACWRGIARIEPPWCMRCGRPVDAAGRSATCGACLLEPPPFDWARAAVHYAGLAREALHAFKFDGKRALARPLADLLLEQWAEPPEGVAGLIPVPLARAREHERGFNQASLLAERIGKSWSVPVRSRWLRRVRPTRPQSDLGAAARSANVHGAFRATADVIGRHVVVVDDVLTTGATVAECARTLRGAGARAIGILTVARVL